MRSPPASSLLLAAALLGGCERSKAPLDPRPEEEQAERQVALDAILREEFEPISSIEALDREVRAVLEQRTRAPMADVGEKYQATDVVLEKRPQRRFVLAGAAKVSRKYWIVVYEHGGIAHHRHVALFAITTSGAATVLSAGSWLPGGKNPVTLTRALESIPTLRTTVDDHW